MFEDALPESIHASALAGSVTGVAVQEAAAVVGVGVGGCSVAVGAATVAVGEASPAVGVAATRVAVGGTEVKVGVGGAAKTMTSCGMSMPFSRLWNCCSKPPPFSL